jgi:hypothetical protein
MTEERRLAWRVLRDWREIADRGRFPRRDEVQSWLRGEDAANGLLIEVGWSIELSQFVLVGVNLAGVLCPTGTLAELILSRVPQIVSSHRGLMIEGVATLRSIGIVYRTVLLPLSEDSITINYVLGAMNFRPRHITEARTTQVHFRRLPMAPQNASKSRRHPGSDSIDSC